MPTQIWVHDDYNTTPDYLATSSLDVENKKF